MHLVIMLLLLVFGVVAGVNGAMAWSRRSLIKSLPTSRIGDAPEGLVELKGRIQAIDLLEGPFSGTRCVYYSYRVQEYRSSGRSGSWVTLNSGTESLPFLLDDGSGTALVRIEGAETDIQSEDRARMGTFSSPEPRLEQFLARIGVSPTGAFGFNRQIRVEEWHLTDGHSLYVLGLAHRPSGAEQGERIVVSKHAGGLFFVSDEDEATLLTTFFWRGLGLSTLGVICALGAIGTALAFLGVFR